MNIKFFLRAFACIVVITIGIQCATLASASAHAQLDSTSPTQGQNVKSSPKYISVSFNEPITTTFGSLKLYDSHGKQIPLSSVKHHGSHTIRSRAPHLTRGAYVVAWSVISADSHPVHGAFVFSVKTNSQDNFASNDEIAHLLEDNRVSKSLSISNNTVRFVLFICFIGIISIICAGIFWTRSTFNVFKKVLYFLLGLCVVVSLIRIGLQASLAGEFSLIKGFHFSIYREEMSARFGIIEISRAVLCAVIALMVFVSTKKTSRILHYILAGFTVVFASTLSLNAHASAGNWTAIAFPLDVLHVLAACSWVGGLVLVIYFIKHRNVFGGKLPDILRKFSQCALICALIIAVTGAFSFWRQVGSIDASTHTYYGKLITAKIILFFATLAIAYFSRIYVKRITAKQDLSLSPLLKLVLWEVSLLLIVFVVTSIVVADIPAKQSLALPASRELKLNKAIVEVVVDPPRVGSNQLHVYLLHKNGTPYQMPNQLASASGSLVQATWRNPKKNVGPIPITLRFEGLNHYISTQSHIPFSGKWTLTLRVQFSEFDEEVSTTQINIR
jgi:copper transport protein